MSFTPCKQSYLIDFQRENILSYISYAEHSVGVDVERCSVWDVKKTDDRKIDE